jgi:hypothetical protein
LPASEFESQNRYQVPVQLLISQGITGGRMRSVAGLYLPTCHAALGGRSPPGDTTNRPTEGPGRQHTTRCVTVQDGPEVPPGKVGPPVLRAFRAGDTCPPCIRLISTLASATTTWRCGSVIVPKHVPKHGRKHVPPSFQLRSWVPPKQVPPSFQLLIPQGLTGGTAEEGGRSGVPSTSSRWALTAPHPLSPRWGSRP